MGVRAILTTRAAAVGGGGVLASVPMLQHNTHFLTIMSGKLMFVNLRFYETPFPTPHCQTHPKKEDKNNSKNNNNKKDATQQTKHPSFENQSKTKASWTERFTATLVVDVICFISQHRQNKDTRQGQQECNSINKHKPQLQTNDEKGKTKGGGGGGA